MIKIKNKKGFTLIELIVVMSIIGILVLLAMPKFIGQTKQAKYTKLISNTKQLENASERYYMNKNDWPRLTDIPYTSAQITDFAQKIYDTTGKEVILDPDGEYYDVNYDKLSTYISVPDDKAYYIIQNPIGNVYALEGLSDTGKNRTQELNQPVTNVILNKVYDAIFIGGNISLTAVIEPSTAVNKNVTWTSSNLSVATVNSIGVVTGIANGTATITATTQDGGFNANCIITVFPTVTNQLFAYTGNSQTFTVPVTGQYKLEAWGAKGGNSIKYTSQSGGQGGYTSGTVTLQSGTTLYIYVGSMGGNGGISGDSTSDNGGYNGGGNLLSGQNPHGAPGGGATDFRLVDGTWNDTNGLQKRILIAGGGGGANTRDDGYGSGKGGAGGGLIGESGVTGNQDSTGLSYGYYYGSGGTQTTGGTTQGLKNGVLTSTYVSGFFGMSGPNAQSSGGGGYYGGGTSSHGGAGGGSSFVTGYTGTDTTYSNLHNGLIFTNVVIQQGGNNDVGRAKVTYVGH